MSDKSYGEHGKASKGGKGATKKDLKQKGLPVNWVNLPGQRKGYNV
jgi:hypothetical protein